MALVSNCFHIISSPSFSLKIIMKKCVITGCSGFIGSNLVDRLLDYGYIVYGIDNFATGQIKFLDNAKKSKNFFLYEQDLLDFTALNEIFAHSAPDVVFHFAANADVRFGSEHPRRDLEQNTIVTYNVLEAMRLNGVREIIFSSTGSVYGEAEIIPTPENCPFPIQTSLYGASKVACEGLIAAYCEAFGFSSWIFRFVSILGNRYTHGHIYDFYKMLKSDNRKLNVLGDGSQRKSYLHVDDCLDAVLLAYQHSNNKVNLFNLGTDGFCSLVQSIDWICKELNVNPILQFTGGSRGWIGDNPFIYLETAKIKSLGWSPRYSIQKGVIDTVKYLSSNEWVFEARF